MDRTNHQITDLQKSQINALRRKAARQGYTVVKSRVRDPDADSYDRFWLMNPDGSREYGEDDGATFDEVANILKRRK